MDLVATFPFLVTQHALLQAVQSQVIVLHSQGLVVSSQMSLVLDCLIIIRI